MKYRCSNCSLRFDTPEKLTNHKNGFCNVDLSSLKSSITQQEVQVKAKLNSESISSSTTTPVTYSNLQSILKPGSDDSNNSLSSMSLADLRKEFQSNEQEMGRLKREFQSSKEVDKADQIRRLKAQQQELRKQKEEEERQLLELLKQMEDQKKKEIETRMAKDQIRNQIARVDKKELGLLSKEAERELEELRKQRQDLLKLEKEALNEINSLETDLTRNQGGALLSNGNNINTKLYLTQEGQLKARFEQQKSLARKEGERVAGTKQIHIPFLLTFTSHIPSVPQSSSFLHYCYSHTQATH
eukprot:TRINITY_DN4284_c0_g2_i1.p1 TRINITY_DN4284_c0_g2~~TRINITY_DN4284_c0_g2_i1.p1  ORF type:complete len:300 (+),score=96.26 TRINITY_DN4284_c0_g2_i1:1081-1980(+)